MAWRSATGRHYIGSTEDLDRRISEHRRGSNHTTRRFGDDIQLVASRELPSATEARELEQMMKRKKNPRLAIHLLKSADRFNH